MEQSIFESLLRSATSQSDYSEKEIAFRGQVGEYEIHFFSKYPFNTLEIYEFGHVFKGEWVEDKPTPLQAHLMMEYIILEIVDYENYHDILKREKQQEEGGYIDPYEEYGVNRRDFF